MLKELKEAASKGFALGWDVIVGLGSAILVTKIERKEDVPRAVGERVGQEMRHQTMRTDDADINLYGELYKAGCHKILAILDLANKKGWVNSRGRPVFEEAIWNRLKAIQKTASEEDRVQRYRELEAILDQKGYKAFFARLGSLHDDRVLQYAAYAVRYARVKLKVADRKIAPRLHQLNDKLRAANAREKRRWF